MPELMWRDAGVARFHAPANVVFGIGAVEQLTAIVRDTRRVIVIVDADLVDAAIHQKVVEALNRGDVTHRVLSVSTSDVMGGLIQLSIDSVRNFRADAIVAVGGARAVDVAAAAAASMPPLPAVSLATISGATSAIDGACATLILDPLAVSSTPAQEAVCSGVAAFVRAYEAHLSQRATVFSDAMSLQAMTLIARSIRVFVADRGNASAALDMLCGSSLAAMASAATGAGIVHGIARTAAASFPVTEGVVAGVCLPHAAALNATGDPERHARIAAILGIDGTGRSEAQRGAQAIHGLRVLCSDLGIPSRLRDVGVTEDRLDELARHSSDASRQGARGVCADQEIHRTIVRAAF